MTQKNSKKQNNKKIIIESQKTKQNKNKEVKNIAKITKDMIIKDIINVNMGCIPILLNEGMHCVGCPASQGETLEEACIVHGLDADVLAKKLNDFVVSVDGE